MKYIGSVLIFCSAVLNADQLVEPVEPRDMSFVPPFYSNIKEQNRHQYEAETVQAVAKKIDPVIVGAVGSMRGKENSIEYVSFDDARLHETTFALHVKDLALRDIVPLISKLANLDIVIDPHIEGTCGLFACNNCTAGSVLEHLCSHAESPLALTYYSGVWRVVPLDTQRISMCHQTFKVCCAHFDDVFKTTVQNFWDKIAKSAVEQGAYISFDDQSRKIFVGAPAAIVERFADFIEEIDCPTAQVRVDATVILARTEFTCNFGFDWSGIYNRQESVYCAFKDFSFVGLGGTLTDFPTPATGPFPNNPALTVSPLNFALNLFPDTARALIKIPFVFGGADLNTGRLNALLLAAEAEAKIKIVARPSVLTNNNDTAQLLVGEQLPIQTVVEDVIEGKVRNVTTINYRDLGIKVIVKPQVSADRQKITLDVTIEDTFVVSGTTKTNERGIMTDPPVIAVVRTQNKVVLCDGQTVVIGGLIRTVQRSQDNRVPLLWRIPVLGWFFRGYSSFDEDREQMIFITPSLA